MAALDVLATLDALATAYSSVPVITAAYAIPSEGLRQGEASCGPPEDIELAATFGRGSDRATFPVWVMAGLPQDRETWAFVTTIIGSASDVLDAVDGDLGGVVQSCIVRNPVIERVELIGGPQVVMVRFDNDVIS